MAPASKTIMIYTDGSAQVVATDRVPQWETNGWRVATQPEIEQLEAQAQLPHEQRPGFWQRLESGALSALLGHLGALSAD
jgi:hypothetical protein